MRLKTDTSKTQQMYGLFASESDSNNSNNIAKYENIFEHFRSVMEYAEVYEQIIPVVCDPEAGMKVLQNNFFDIIFINGDYGYHSVYKDIINSIKMIKCGGLIIGNNCECYANQLPDHFFKENNRNIDLVEGYHCGIIKALDDVWGRDYEHFNNGLLWYKKVQKEDKDMYQDRDSYQYKTTIEAVKGIIKNLSKKLNYIYLNINKEKLGKFNKKINGAIIKISRAENMLLPIYNELQDSELKIMTNQFKCLLIILKIILGRF
jgi:hypothetical protein